MTTAPTIGYFNYQSVINDYPILRNIIPNDIVEQIDSARMMLQYAKLVERQAFEAGNAVIAAHNAGYLTQSDYTNYDAFRHKVHDTQVAWLLALRQMLAQLPGGSIAAGQIPWPGWLTPLRPSTPRGVPAMVFRGSPPPSTAGLGVAGADDFVGVAAIAAVAIGATLLAGFIVQRLSEAFQQWIITHGQTEVITTSVNARRAAYEACIAAGTSSAQCAQQVVAAIPAPSQAAMDAFIRNSASSGRGAVWYFGAFALSATVIGIGWYGWRQGWFTKQKGA